MFSSMTADICDEDELVTGLRREGAYVAVGGFFGKVAQVATLLLAGALPRMAGYVDMSVPPALSELKAIILLATCRSSGHWEPCSMEVVCAGNLVADIFASPIAALPAAGQLSLTERFLFGAGGCATNTAACLCKLGRTAKVLGKVGDDVFGSFVIEELKRLGIDASSVSRSRTHPTSTTAIINITGEERRYIHCIGANADFSFSDIDFSTLNGAKALYVGGYMAMPRFGVEDLTQLFREAKKRSLATFLDVVIPSGLSISSEQVAAMLAYTDVVLPNDNEAYALTGLREPRAQAGYLARMNPATRDKRYPRTIGLPRRCTST